MTTKIPVSLSQAFYNKEMRPNASGDVRSKSFIATDATLEVFASHLRTGNAWAVATYKGNHRKEDHFIQSQIVALDLDSTSMQTAKQNPDIAKYALILHETPSHTNRTPKARVIFVLDKPIPRLDAWRKAQAAVLHKFAELEPDKSCHDGARYFYGSTGNYITQAGNRLPVVVIAEWVKEHEAHEAAQLATGPGQSSQADSWDGDLPPQLIEDVMSALGTDPHSADNNGWTNRVKCPIGKHEHDDKKPAFLWNTKTNSGKCHKCGNNYNTHDTAAALGIDSGPYYKAQPLKTAQAMPPIKPSGVKPPTPPVKQEGFAVSDVKVIDTKKKFNNAVANPNLVPGFKTDMRKLNIQTGGMQRGTLWAIVGETGGGKTQLCTGFTYAAMNQTPVLCLSVESSAEQLHNRFVSYIANHEQVAYGDLMRGQKIFHQGIKLVYKSYSHEDQRIINRAYDTLAKFQDHGRLFIPEKLGMMRLEDLYINAGNLIKKEGIGYIMWDGFGDTIIPGLSVSDKTTLTMTMAEKIARDFNVAIVGTSQGGRNTKYRSDKMLKVHDGAGGSAVEGKSHIHMSIYDPWYLLQQGMIERNDIDETKIPQGQAILHLNKIRDGALMNNSIPVLKRGGAGFYELPDQPPANFNRTAIDYSQPKNEDIPLMTQP